MIQDISNVPENGRTPIWYQGKLVPFEDATLHIISHALNYGSAIFEGVRVYDTAEGTAIFHLHDHLKRFFASAEKFGLQTDYTYEQVVSACIETVKASGHSQGYIRPQLQFGLSKPGLGSTTVTELFVYFWPMGKYRTSDNLKVVLSEIERISPKSGDIEAKVMGYYTNSHFNYRFAHERGADDAIMLNVEGDVAEASSANIFLVKDGKLITPKTGHILKGITRGSVIQLAAKELGLATDERIVKPEELASADEIFLTGTAAEIDPVTIFDDAPVGDGNAGEITTKLKALYSKATLGELPGYDDWNTYVN